MENYATVFGRTVYDTYVCGWIDVRVVRSSRYMGNMDMRQ